MNQNLKTIAQTLTQEIEKHIELVVEKNLFYLKKELANKEKIFFTLKEAATYLNLSEKTIYQYINSNKISYYKPNNGKVFFKINDLNKYILNERNHIKSRSDIECEIETQMICNNI